MYIVSICPFTTFSQIFEENLTRRSRTAKGVSDTGTSKTKKKLLKEGEELRAQVRANTQHLIQTVWDARRNHGMRPDELRQMMERWYDIIQRDLQDDRVYAEERAKLQQEMDRLGLRSTSDFPLTVNPRYRLWPVSYSKRNIQPIELETAMQKFYETLHALIQRERGALKTNEARLLAFADVELDGEIHPWLDGCGRLSTAVVMWLSLLNPDWYIPVFQERDEHYRCIHNLGGHTEYFERCLRS